ncbi:MAG: bifunctional YncE family protein/alkaline phosphatase family protein, partial [bacterium]
NDNLSAIDIKKDTVVHTINLRLTERVKNFRGIIPFGLAISPDEKRLYVAESGINAVGVIDVATMKVIGHIPVGWFPAKLAVTPDGKKLIVSNAKGFGSGPNGGVNFNIGPEGSYIGSLMKGTVTVLDIPSDTVLEKTTQQVISNNFTIEKASSKKFDWRKSNPVPLYPGQKASPIKHIVFISKENRTYDEVLGQLKKGEGDSSLARYGTGATFMNRAKTEQVENATVMANHLQLAYRFAISDNFYVDSDVSADGHRWLVNTYPNEWVETATPASYGGNRNFNPQSKAPGSPAMTNAAGAIYPEDYNEAGSLWEHLSRNHIDFFNFGFGIMFEPASYHRSYKYTGIRHLYNFPLPAPMFDKTSKSYPTFNMAIPDQFRVDMFMKEFNEKWVGTGKTLPQVLTVILPNDHGAGDRPDAGYPFRESYMADNDLALGRIVEFLSHTEYWKNMAIIVTEDDAQNGVDHIDAHRSILMLISPYAKKDYVSHVHYSFGSIFKTFWNILGLPYLNQYDAGATDMADMFTNEPDFTPYNARAVDMRIFDPQKALDPFDEQFNWQALENSPIIDNPQDMLRESKEVDRDRSENREK